VIVAQTVGCWWRPTGRRAMLYRGKACGGGGSFRGGPKAAGADEVLMTGMAWISVDTRGRQLVPPVVCKNKILLTQKSI
jgi:hypothetical protein